MRPGGSLFRHLLRIVVRTALASALIVGLYASVMLISTESLTVWSGIATVQTGYTVAPDETLELDPNADTTLTLGGNLVVQGVLRSRPAPGITHSIRFTGIDETKFIGGGNEPLASDIGLWVTGAGRLDLAGDEKLAWTRAAASLAPGATSAVLDNAPVGWQAGDEIVIAPTENPNVNGFSHHEEVRTLTSVSGSTIGFEPLSYAHPRVTVKPGVSYGAEVVNLTRSVRIEGQDPTHRTHVWIKSSVPQSIRNVAIRHVGPQAGFPAGSVLGRYGLHFHRMGEGSRGSLVEGVVVRQTGGPAFATHASNGVTLRNTVAFEVQGVAYWYDPGAMEAPNDTVYEGVLAGSVVPTPEQSPGYRLTAFWMGRGFGNACVRCVAFGVRGAKNSSGFGWPEAEIGIWRFEDSLAHNNTRNGIFVWQNATRGHVVDRFTAYHNGSAGIEHGAYTNEYHYRDSVLYGNKTAGVILHAETMMQPPPTSFQRTYVDGAGITQHAVVLRKPTNPGQPPSVWCGATMLGLTGPAFIVNYTGLDASVSQRLLILPVCPADLIPTPPPVAGVPPIRGGGPVVPSATPSLAKPTAKTPKKTPTQQPTAIPTSSRTPKATPPTKSPEPSEPPR